MIKLFNTLSSSFFLSFSCCTGTQKAPIFFTLLEICPACVCECVMVASLRFYLATDESASVATTAGATLTAISQRQLRFPLLQTTTTTTINNSSVATIAVFFGDRIWQENRSVEWLCKCLLLLFAFHTRSQLVSHTHIRTGCRTNLRTRTHIQANFVVFVRAGQTMCECFVLFFVWISFVFLLI